MTEMKNYGYLSVEYRPDTWSTPQWVVYFRYGGEWDYKEINQWIDFLNDSGQEYTQLNESLYPSTGVILSNESTVLEAILKYG